MTGLEVSYLGAAAAGALSFLSPCVLPLVPPYLAFVSGVSLHQQADGERLPVAKIFYAALAFVLGFATIFVALGATASSVSRFLTAYSHWLTPLAGVIIIVLGLHFLGAFRILLLYREARFHPGSKPAGLVGAYVIGLAFAFGWTPCVGPALAVVLMVAAQEQSAWYGASLLAVYALGLGVPFLLAALAVERFMAFMKRARRHMVLVERAMGGLLVVTGVLFITGSMSDLSYWLLDTFPALGRIG